jgi:hypothetical protein
MLNLVPNLVGGGLAGILTQVTSVTVPSREMILLVLGSETWLAIVLAASSVGTCANETRGKVTVVAGSTASSCCGTTAVVRVLFFILLSRREGGLEPSSLPSLVDTTAESTDDFLEVSLDAIGELWLLLSRVSDIIHCWLIKYMWLNDHGGDYKKETEVRAEIYCRKCEVWLVRRRDGL